MLGIKGAWPGITRAIKVRFITDFKWRTEHREYNRPVHEYLVNTIHYAYVNFRVLRCLADDLYHMHITHAHKPERFSVKDSDVWDKK